MNTPDQMTRAELLRAIDRAEAECSAVCDAMIEAGRGYERHSETMTKMDPLSCRFRIAHQRAGALNDEKRARMEYSGTLQRIRRQNAFA